MVFIVAGVLLIALKLADVAPVVNWDWWWVLAPFGLAAAWWAYADATGMTKRREMDKLEERKTERRRKAMDALGIDRSRQKREDAAQRAKRKIAQKVEGQRAQKRERNEKVIRDSVIDSRHGSSFGDSANGAAPKKP